MFLKANLYQNGGTLVGIRPQRSRRLFLEIMVVVQFEFILRRKREDAVLV